MVVFLHVPFQAYICFDNSKPILESLILHPKCLSIEIFSFVLLNLLSISKLVDLYVLCIKYADMCIFSIIPT